MSPRPPQNSHADNHNAYIPSSAQAAMSRQMQQNMPAHLQKYVGSNKPAYVPQHAQAELTNYMQKNMPSHLQQYAGAYVQQKVVDPTARGSFGSREAKAPPPTARFEQQSRSGVVPGEQPNAQFLNLYQPDAAPGQAAQPMILAPGQVPTQSPVQPPTDPAAVPPGPNPAPGTGATGHDPYEFIMNPDKPKKKPLSLPLGGGSSILGRIALVGGVLVILVIVIIIVSSLISAGGKEKTASLLTIAQDQTEIIRVATAGALVARSEPTQNLTQDVLATITSDNGQLLAYMTKNGQKVAPAQLTLAHSKTADATLASAQQNNTYDSAFQDIMQTDLTSYMTALQTAYKANPGPKGKVLLAQQYTSATTLLKLSKQSD